MQFCPVSWDHSSPLSYSTFIVLGIFICDLEWLNSALFLFITLIIPDICILDYWFEIWDSPPPNFLHYNVISVVTESVFNAAFLA